MACGSDDASQPYSGARLYDTESGELLAEFGAKQHGDAVIAAVFKDETTLYTAGRDGSVIPWQIPNDPRKIRALPERADLDIGPLTDLAYHKDPLPRLKEVAGNGLQAGILAVSGSGRSVVILDAGTMKVLKLISLDDPGSPVHKIAFNDDGGLLAAATADTISIIDMGRLAPLLPISDLHGKVTALAFDDRDHLIIGNSQGAVLDYRPAKGEAEQEAPDKIKDTLRPEDIGTVAIDDNGSLIAAGARDTLLVWSVQKDGKLDPLAPWSFSPSSTPASVFPPGVYRVAFLPAKKIAAGLSDGSVHIFEVGSNELRDVGTFVGPDPFHVFALTASAKSGFLAAGTINGFIELFHLGGNFKPFKSWMHDPSALQKGQYGRTVRDLQFGPTGNLASAGADGIIRIWNPEGILQCSLEGHHYGVRSIAFDKTGQWLVSGSEDNTAMLWNLARCSGRSKLEPYSVLHSYSDLVGGVGFTDETLWVLSSNGHVTVYSLESDGRPREREAYDLVVPSAFKISTGRDHVVISTAANDIYVYPGNSKGIARLSERLFPPEAVGSHNSLLSTQEPPDPGLAALAEVRKDVNCAYQSDWAQRLLNKLTRVARDHPDTDIDANLWDDLCFYGTSSDGKPDPIVMRACYAAVSTNPSDSNSRSSLAIALARQGDQEGAIREYRLARLKPGFAETPAFQRAFEALPKDKHAFESIEVKEVMEMQRGNNAACSDGKFPIK